MVQKTAYILVATIIVALSMAQLISLGKIFVGKNNTQVLGSQEIQLTEVPNGIYSTFLTFVLMGSYLFFVYNEVLGKLFKRVRSLEKVYNKGLALFLRAGYSYTWGTK